ncbi:MAG: divalent-cation tolerance protein CutA [Pseudomonadota bacterium]
MTPTRLLLTCPDINTARAIAGALLDARLVACANIYPEIESHYMWDGARQVESEVPMALKTRADLIPAIEAKLQDLHPYDVPALVAQHLDFAHGPYADWIAEMTDAP